MATRPTVHIVDDDAAVRDSLRLLLRLHGYACIQHASGDLFLDAVEPDQPVGIVLLDLRMPGRSGTEVQAELAARGMAWPVILLTAHGDAASARATLKAGAVDFIEKPIDDELLLAALGQATALAAAAEENAAKKAETDRRLARLTPREKQVLAMVIDGRHNREVAAALGISPRTVEVYKARLMDKLDVERLPDLIRLSVEHALHERG
ncbi:MAG: response regulator [Burkholderiales bacterium]